MHKMMISTNKDLKFLFKQEHVCVSFAGVSNVLCCSETYDSQTALFAKRDVELSIVVRFPAINSDRLFDCFQNELCFVR
jgi:hypothetical protein